MIPTVLLLGLLLVDNPTESQAPVVDWSGAYAADGDPAEVDYLLLNSDGTFRCASRDYGPYAALKNLTKEQVDAGVGWICGNALSLAYTGKWQLNSSIVALEFDSDHMIRTQPQVPARWMAIEWDQRRYLVPEGRIVDFCNEVNFGFEPRHTRDGRFALREGDHQKPAQGWPTLAEEWRSFLLLEPIQGKLERIGEDGFGYLDIGEASGLRAGMVLLAYHEGQMRSWRLKVLCPCGPSARVEIIEIPRMEIPKPRDVMPGDIVTTKAL